MPDRALLPARCFDFVTALQELENNKLIARMLWTDSFYYPVYIRLTADSPDIPYRNTQSYVQFVHLDPAGTKRFPYQFSSLDCIAKDWYELRDLTPNSRS